LAGARSAQEKKDKEKKKTKKEKQKGKEIVKRTKIK